MEAMLDSEYSLFLTRTEPPCIVAATAALQDFSGFSAQTLIGRPLSALLSESDVEQVTVQLRKLAEGEPLAPSQCSVQLPSQNGDRHSFIIRVSPMYDAHFAGLDRFALTLLPEATREEEVEIASPPGSDCGLHDAPHSEEQPSTIEGVRNVAPSVERLLQGRTLAGHSVASGTAQRLAWSALFASALQKEMFKNVILTRQTCSSPTPDWGCAAETSSASTASLSSPTKAGSDAVPAQPARGFKADARGQSRRRSDGADESHDTAAAAAAPGPAESQPTPSAEAAAAVRAAGPGASTGSGSSDNKRHCGERVPDNAYEIWHVSHSFEELLGFSANELVGSSALALRSRGEAPPPLLDQVGELHRAIACRENKLIETVLASSTGAPVFCLAVVLPLHCAGPRATSVAVAFLDVHSSLPLLQRHMEERGLHDCDLYTFMRLSLLNILITDPSVTSTDPHKRNPIVFASAGFGLMCGCAPHEVLHRNCRFLQSSAFLQSRAGSRSSAATPHGSANNSRDSDESAEDVARSVRDKVASERSGARGDAAAGRGVSCGIRSTKHSERLLATYEEELQSSALAHMAKSLDARQESLTFVTNFRKDGSRFGNILFMTPILEHTTGGVLFWVGVQHLLNTALDEAGAANASVSVPTGKRGSKAGAQPDFAALLRSCQQGLQSLQMQELYGSYVSASQRTAMMVHDGSTQSQATTICRLCENHVLVHSLQSHTQYCKTVSQCKTIASCSDMTLSKMIGKLNAVANTAYFFGGGSSQAAMLLELLRSYTMIMLSITASSYSLPLLAAMPPKFDELVAAAEVMHSTASIWADVKAAGMRKMMALQHASQWTVELQQTVVQTPGADPLAVGQPPTLQDFDMVREIQRGSHAAVWLVRKKQTQDVFAMKVIDKQRGRMHRLHTERKVLFQCHSPFVVTVFFAFEDAERLHLVMECLASDVKHLLQRRGVLEELQAVSIMADVTLALEHLHSCGIVHRDLKPENMLMTAEGRVKLADFGLSHISARAAVSEEELVRDPSIVGTPFYMAPETIRGKARGLEMASDWWSYGAILYELITGFTPFQGAKVAEIYRAILSMTFACPVNACSISAEAADLISRILVANPRQRLVGAAHIMMHPFFRAVDWPTHAYSASGSSGPSATTAPTAAKPVAAFDCQPTLQTLASMTSSLQQPSAPQPAVPRSETASDAGRQSSIGDSDRSIASTHIPEMHPLQQEDSGAHIDNLTALNSKVWRSQPPGSQPVRFLNR